MLASVKIPSSSI